MMEGIMTMNPPRMLTGFNATKTYVEFFGLQDDKLLISPEFPYLASFQNFEINPEVDPGYEDVILGMRDSRLLSPFYILSILERNCTDIPKYCSDNFLTWLTFLYRNRGLPPLVVQRSVKDILNGTESAYLTEMQRRSPRFGGDPTLRTSFNVLPYEGNLHDRVKIEVFSGNVNPDRARNMLRYNGTYEYITVERQFYHTDSDSSLTGVRTERINPWNEKVYLSSATDGSQFVPDMQNNDDLLFFSPYFKAIINVDFKTITTIYRMRGFVYQTPLTLYEQRDKQVINSITIGDKNPYHNYVYDDVFNASSVFGVSYFVTEPVFSRTEGQTDKIESTILNSNGNVLNGELYYNDNII